MLSLQSPFRLKTRADLPLYSSPRIRSTHQISRRDFLLTRARVTNLGLLLLASFATLSFLVNLGYYFSPTRRPARAGFPYAHPYGILSTIDRDETLNWLNHLIIVPGHAIWKGVDAKRRLEDDEWVLEAYQRGGGRVSAFVQHIERGIELMAEDEHALLVFSGGQTRRTSTTTEAESYLRLALSSGLLSDNPNQVLRATTENYALDSYQNLLFSVARFHEYTGHYPRYITIIGYEMKRRRFEELHRAALRWPRSNFDYLGIDAEGEEAIGAIEGEKRNGYLPYTRDTYGCHGLLQSKRRSRNPFMRYHSYYTSSPELGALMNWCPGPTEGGQTAVYKGPLPWDGIRST